MKQSEMQAIRSVLRDDLRILQQIKTDLKDDINYHWIHANKETNCGKYHFLCLNSKRQDMIDVNKKIKRLNDLTRSVRKSMRSSYYKSGLFAV